MLEIGRSLGLKLALLGCRAGVGAQECVACWCLWFFVRSRLFVCSMTFLSIERDIAHKNLARVMAMSTFTATFGPKDASKRKAVQRPKGRF